MQSLEIPKPLVQLWDTILRIVLLVTWFSSVGSLMEIENINGVWLSKNKGTEESGAYRWSICQRIAQNLGIDIKRLPTFQGDADAFKREQVWVRCTSSE